MTLPSISMTFFFCHSRDEADPQATDERRSPARGLGRLVPLLFTLPLDESLLSYIWRIGIRHVEVYLDQRFSNLGFLFGPPVLLSHDERGGAVES